MKFTGHGLEAVLTGQRDPVLFVEADGREAHNVSPRYVASVIAGREFTGYGKNKTITMVVATAVGRRSFAMRADIAAAAAAGIHRLRGVKKNPQEPGAKLWKPQPAFANTGQAARFSTIWLKK